MTTAVPKQPDQVIPIRVPRGTPVPGARGTAPTSGAGGFPGIANESTTLWLASVPLLHGLLRFRDAARRDATRRVPLRS